MKTKKNLLLICVLLINITLGWSQVLCEKCTECEEEEQAENVENANETEDADYKFDIGEEGEEGEDMLLDEADILGEEIGEEVGEEIAEEVVVEVATETIAELTAALAVNVLPVVGQILSGLAIIGLSGYFLYELSKDTDANRRKHKLALERHRAALLEHNSWSPLFPSFSININDLESKRDTVSFILNIKNQLGKEQLQNYFDEHDIRCEVAYDDNGIHQSISVANEPMIDFTPCAFETYVHSYTNDIENDSYRSEYGWTIPDIDLFVENKQIKTVVKSLWVTKFIEENHPYKYELKRSTVNPGWQATASHDNVLGLKLAEVSDEGFKEIASIPYTAKDNGNGIITIRVNNFDFSKFDEKKYWVLVKVTGHETYGHTYQYLDANMNPVGSSNMPTYTKAIKARQKFIELEAKGNYDQVISNFDAGDGYKASDYPYIEQAKISPTFLDGLGSYDPQFVLPLPSQRKTLFYAQLRDFQPHDTEKTIANKDVSEINVFPTLETIPADFGSAQGEQLKISENGKNHFLIEFQNYKGAKEISYIEFVNLSLQKNIICELEVTPDNAGVSKSINLNAVSHSINEINEPIKVNAVQEDLLGDKYLSADSSQIVLHEHSSAWVLQNLPLSAGEKVYLTVHYEDGTLSKSLVSIPNQSASFKRGYHTIKVTDDNGNSYLTVDKNEYGENILVLNQDQSVANNEESQWLIEHYGGSLYTFMNKKSKKVLAIKNGRIGTYFWDPYDMNQFWNVNTLKGDNVRLMSVGSKTFISGELDNVYHSSEGDEIHFKVDFLEEAEAILSDEDRFIISREGSRYLSGSESILHPQFCNFDETRKHRVRMLYHGNLHYTIENVNENIDTGKESTYALHSNRKYHEGKLSWSNTTTTPWLYTKIDDNYFALSSKNNWIDAVYDESKKCDDVLSEVYDANIPSDNFSRHFSFSPSIYPDYSNCKTSTTDSSFEWIKEITMGEYNNLTGDLTTDDNYGLYNFENWNFIAGESYDFSISLGIILEDERFYRVWMDFNRNGSFESDEIMLSNNSTISENSSFSHPDAIVIPEDITPGPIRMRVAVGYSLYPPNCETFFYGEVEDYIVTIKPKIDYSNCTSENNNSKYEWIESFSMGPYTNDSGDNGGYALFDNNPPWSFNLNGEAYEVKYNIGLLWNFTETVNIWIDLDQSGYFEDSELIYSHRSYMINPSQMINGGRISIPRGVNTKPGITRMRVALKFLDKAKGCENNIYGEVEDYTIRLVPATFDSYTQKSITAQNKSVNFDQKESDQTLSSIPPSRDEIVKDQNQDSFTLFPNPANDIVSFNFTLNSKSSSEGGVIIYNILGKEVQRLEKVFTKGVNNFNVSVKNFSTGIYSVKLYQNKSSNIFRKRLIIE